MGDFNIEVLKYESSAIDRDQESSAVCNKTNATCFKKYIKCSKGIFAQPDEQCNSPFYTLHTAIAAVSRDEKGNVNTFSTALATTFVTPLAGIAGTVFAEKKFNTLYNNILIDYNIEGSKSLIFDQLESYQNYKPCNIANYQHAEFAIHKNGCFRNSGDGLYVFTKDSDFFKIDYNDVLSLDITRSVSLADNDFKFLTLVSKSDLNNTFVATQKITQALVNNYMSFEKMYPKIELPKILPSIVLEKGEFEKSSDFQKRKYDAIEKRALEQQKLNEDYILKVKNRNEKYFDELRYRQNKIKTKIFEFQKQAILAIAQKPLFRYKSYDPENEILYADTTTINNGWQQIMFEVAPSVAQSIKNNQNNVDIIFTFSDKKNEFNIETILVDFQNYKFQAKYTDVSYKPDIARVVLPEYDLAKYQSNISSALGDAKDLNQNALRELQNLENWRIIESKPISDVNVKMINAKFPQWYSNVSCSLEQCAVARAQTQEEALKLAMAQLGCMTDSQITSSLIIKKSKIYGYVNKEREYTVEQTCNNNFSKQKIKVQNLEELDGWYYIKIATEQ